MSALTNAKHERFAQEIAKGSTAAVASFESGLRLNALEFAAEAYVYLLVDPRDGRVFYVGKGRGVRATVHSADVRAGRARNVFKIGRIEAIHRAGQEVEIFLVANGLTDGQAYRIERMLIIRCHSQLTNIALGERCLEERELEATRNGLRSLKSFCQLVGEGASAERLALLSRVVTSLRGVERKQRAMFLGAA